MSAGDAADINDPAATRVFTFQITTGNVRVTERYDGNGNGKVKANDPVAHFTCPLPSMSSGMTVTIMPAS